MECPVMKLECGGSQGQSVAYVTIDSVQSFRPSVLNCCRPGGQW